MTTDELLQQLIREIQILTGGMKQDLAYRRNTKFQALETKKATLTTNPSFLEFSEPLSEVTIAITDMGSASTVYVEIEGTAGTNSTELNSTIRTLSFGGITIKRISAMTDAGTTTKIQAFGLRGG